MRDITSKNGDFPEEIGKIDRGGGVIFVESYSEYIFDEYLFFRDEVHVDMYILLKSFSNIYSNIQSNTTLFG